MSVIVVGAGQAGLAVSHELTVSAIEHVVLERGRIGATWRGRWDTFCLVTPNWSVRLPGGAYDGSDPDGYLPRDDIVRHLEGYARSFAAPVREGVDVRSLEPATGGFLLRTNDGELRADTVVLTTTSRIAVATATNASIADGAALTAAVLFGVGFVTFLRGQRLAVYALVLDAGAVTLAMIGLIAFAVQDVFIGEMKADPFATTVVLLYTLLYAAATGAALSALFAVPLDHPRRAFIALFAGVGLTAAESRATEDIVRRRQLADAAALAQV